ncbi:biopolymer transporter ExbD [Rubrivirga sp. SAORIC476]|uniref:ExbD/TolR family protein n=1 Tax=Rubrivirga sp. SAORIC476 TaxID=1961794 RepID=UPI000BA92120|nr:biopolymer transporter ExbD [Rubrivirga sp. SAORIC476]MAQ93010.1 biopolymer transporter ExbD [Rhodothermaceae bacterium]MBC13919.1 biopolymer transporter ExbD [Rhodothermaceae bacterium]PAP74899.1 biopolymer transporter ExbD [Rubrivirga sp. SAORIC476]
MASFNFSTGRKALTAFSLASLTDIVLLLLIFFLLTSSFVTQNGLRVTLPDVAAAAPLEQLYVAITIDEDGLFFVEDREVARDSLTMAIEAVREGKTSLAVYADKEATIDGLAAVASAASALDMRVSIATEAATPSE